MKRSLSLSTFLILYLLFLPLAACTGASGTDTLNSNVSSDLPLASQLALGTLKLDDTTFPIDQTQVTELLTLWKALRSLIISDTAASQEIEALVNQIQNALTSEQLDIIIAMQLTNEDLSAFLQAQGPMTGGFGGGTPDASAQATRQARIQSGEFSPRQGGGPGGGIPPEGGGGYGGGFGGGMGLQITGTPGAIRQNSSGINIALVNLVIQFLEAK